MGKLHTKDVVENLLKDQSFCLIRITLYLRRTSQESINLERKSYLDCSLDGEEFGRVTYWLQTLRSWKRWTHQKSTLKDSMQRRWYSQTRRIYFSNRRWTNQNRWRRARSENIHLDTGLPNSRRRSKRFSFRIRRVSSTTSGLISGCRWSNERLLVHVGKLHIPPSRWTKSQAFLAERRIFPCSTEMHWRIQNYKNKFGCQARKPYRWLLEYRCIKRFVGFLDRFHSVYSIKWETSRRIYVVRVETHEKAANIQARSFMARTLGENGEGHSLQHYKLVHKLTPMPQAVKIPEAEAAMDKKWEKLEKISEWNLTKVRNKSDVINEVRKKGRGSTFCVINGSLSSQECWVREETPEV